MRDLLEAAAGCMIVAGLLVLPAVVPELDRRVFQQPSGADFRDGLLARPGA